MQVDRGFVRIREGQIHYRRAGPETGGATVLWMIHASPASSVTLLPLMGALAAGRVVIAPDTPGNGDSCPPALAEPDMNYYADSALRTMDALGVDHVDLFGSHTGAHIAVEMAISRPDRVSHLVLDGIGMFDAATKEMLLEHYAPAMTPDIIGSQFNWAWHFVRDQATHFPYFLRDPGHRRDVAMPSAKSLHTVTLEVLKSLGTYHLGYRAAFRHPDRERLPLVSVPTLVMADRTDPLSAGVAPAASLVPGARAVILEGESTELGLAEKARVIAGFLGDG